MAPFSSTDRARSVEPVTVRRCRSTRTRSISAFAPWSTAICRAALEREQLEISRKVRAADHVEDDVDAASSRQFHQARDEIVRTVGDRALGPEPLARATFLIRAGRREHTRAECPRHLDGAVSSAGASMHENVSLLARRPR
jgi:hypothetical protein